MFNLIRFFAVGILLIGMLQEAAAQDKRLSYYQYPEKVDPKQQVNPVKDYQRMMNVRIKNQKKRHQKIFAEEVAFDKANRFRYGNVYVGWTEMEVYLNQILAKITPEEMKTNKKLKVYSTNSSEVNAYALHDPTIYFNIGLLAEVADEAGIAAILGHELSHIRNKDVQNGYFEKLKLKSKRNRDKDNMSAYIVNAHEDRKFERKADSLGAIWTGKAGYDLRAAVDVFYKFTLLSDRKKMNENSLENEISPVFGKLDTVQKPVIDPKDLLSSHPDLKLRIAYYQKFIDKNNLPTAKRFLVSEATFNKLQEQAKRENLQTMLANFEYRECVEKAFVYYLLDPNNEVYNYYILEGIRRLSVFDGSIFGKGFIVDNMPNANLAYSKGVLNNLKLIVPDDITFNKIKQKEMRDSNYVLFNTWSEAFDYFADLAEVNNYTESMLTIALKNSDSIAMQNFYLDKYLAEDQNPRYKEFAQSLKGDSLAQQLYKNKTKLMLSSRVQMIEDRKTGYRMRSLLSLKKNPKYQRMLANSLKHYFVNYQYQSLYNLTNTNLNKFVKLNNLTKTTIALKMIENNKMGNGEKVIFANNANDMVENTDSAATASSKVNSKKSKKKGSYKKSVVMQNSNNNIKKYFMHDPEFWYLFKTEKLKSVSYYNAKAFDDKTKLWNLLNAVNPLYLYWGWYTDLANHIAFGSNRFEYKVEYFEFDPTNVNNEVYYYEQLTNYKLTPLLYANGLYYAINKKYKLEENAKKNK